MSKIYIDGCINDIPLLFDGKPFFRKITTSESEKEIALILMKNPHPNIVSIYNIGFNSYDIELIKPVNEEILCGNIDIDNIFLKNMNKSLCDAKNHLQSLGIVYIDWKIDNIGIDQNNNIKLYDFDSSGIIDVKTHNWIKIPIDSYLYRKTIYKGFTNPLDIDNNIFRNLKYFKY